MSLAALEESKLFSVAASIVRKLHDSGFIALFAGGCVRDALRGVAPHDIDIATSARPEQVQTVFHRTIPVGVQFGVVRVLEKDFEFEVATFRSDDVYLDGRHPASVHFSTPEEDAHRRDFGVNSMFYDPLTGEVIDFVGGKADLDARQIRAIGEPEKRFGEDRLRLMRAIRFATVLEFQIEHQTWNALREAAPQISVVSPERVREELVKILGHPQRVRGFDLLDESGLLASILPEVAALKGCKQPAEFHPEGDVFVHTRKMLETLNPDATALVALSVLLHDIGKPPTQSFDAANQRIRFNGHDRVGADMAEQVMERFRFSRHETDAVVEAVRNHMVFKDVQQMRPSRLRRFMARPTFDAELELHRVDCVGSHGDLENYDFLRKKAEEYSVEPLIPPPLIRGRDLLELGLKPGPRIGELLEAVETAQLEGEIKTREEAFKLLESLGVTAEAKGSLE
jgi:poly(A) polymerase